jgi:hypothetical protein
VAADGLTAETGETVELIETTLLPVGERAPMVARSRVEEHQPGVVILPVGAWVFATGFVWLRVRRLFGNRAGRWFRGIEMSFDSATKAGSPLRRRTNRAVRWLARTMIGTEPFTTREEGTRAIEAILRELSQVEDIQVVVVAYAGVAATKNKPAMARERLLFLDAVRAAAERHHFGWVDCSAEFSRAEATMETIDRDGLHVSPGGHQLLGEMVAASLAAGLPE